MEKGSIKFFLFLGLILFSGLPFLPAFSQQLTQIESGLNTSLRGLSVVNHSVIWVSGSKGYTALSTDAGKTWKWNQVKGFEKFDFRDIEGFSENKAVMVSAGSPAVILLTVNGGKDWEEVYRNSLPDIFLDGMDFWNADHGIIYGDPIAGQMQILETTNGGMSWQNISHRLKIKLVSGEAGFAASGTGIRSGKKGNVWIATGGIRSRIFHSKDYGQSWQVYPCPIIQGNASSGIFSIAFYNKKTGVAAGGDYLKDTLRNNNLLITGNGGQSWKSPKINPLGYRSAIEYVSRKVLIATGTTGTDISGDGGLTWKKLSDTGFNCVRKAKNGKLIVLTGDQGRIALVQQ